MNGINVYGTHYHERSERKLIFQRVSFPYQLDKNCGGGNNRGIISLLRCCRFCYVAIQSVIELQETTRHIELRTENHPIRIKAPLVNGGAW